jgi:hypothetical protein
MCEIESRLKEYLNLGKYFMVDVCDIDGCIKESQKSQRYLSELIELKDKLSKLVHKKKDKVERFMSEKRDIIRTTLQNNGVSVTEKMVEDRVSRVHAEELYKLKDELDNDKINLETTESLLMAMFQRKDLIKEYMTYLRSNCEKEGCILSNKAFIKRLEKQLGI